jgi:hypothetical protein
MLRPHSNRRLVHKLFTNEFTNPSDTLLYDSRILKLSAGKPFRAISLLAKVKALTIPEKESFNASA